MTAVGGSIIEISLNGRVFAVAADAEAQRKLGGFEAEVLANGNGSARIIKSRVPWGLDGVVVEIDDTKGDAEYIESLKKLNDFFPISMILASALIYQGSGMITGETPTSSQAATMPIGMMGPGEMTKQ